MREKKGSQERRKDETEKEWKKKPRRELGGEWKGVKKRETESE